MRGRIALWAIVCGLSLTFAGQARADGVAYESDPESPFERSPQDEQIAAVAHRDGIEKLIIAINIDLEEDEKALWMFPVPGTPDQVKLDVVDVFRLFEGYDPRQTARLQSRSLGRALTATQIYPALFRLGTVTQGRAYPLNAGGVFVNDVVEKWGIHAETVKAASEQELARYLEKQGVGLPPGGLSAFDGYLNQDYVLVLVWIASWEEALKEFPRFRTPPAWDADRWPCVHVQFPTERPFYPLRPTASYGDVPLEIKLFLEGHFDVARKEELDYFLSVDYFRHKGCCQACRMDSGRVLPAATFRTRASGSERQPGPSPRTSGSPRSKCRGWATAQPLT